MATENKSLEQAQIEQRKLFESLQKRYKAAKGIADLWSSLLEACFRYAIPERNRFYYQSPDFQGDSKNSRIYDTTLVDATKTFVSKLHDTMTPPQVQWGYLEVDVASAAQDYRDEQIQQAQLILSEYNRQVFSYIHQSNFDVVINECYFDLAIGTSSLVINQHTDAQPFLCTSIPIDKLAIEESANGRIESWFRTWQNLKIAELNTRWRKLQLSPTMMSDLLNDPDAKCRQIYEGVAYYPNVPKPYCYAVWNDEMILYKEFLESNPGIVWRFQKTNNETWGRGPVMEALPSMISLNELAYIEFASANLNTFRPYMAWSDAVFNPYTFKLRPFEIIPIAPIGSEGSPPLIPLPGSADPRFAEMKIQDLRMQIKSLLFAEAPEDSVSVQPQTAFELSLKQQSLAQKIGPLFSRLQQEFLKPVYDRFCYILDKMGKVPKPKLEGFPIKFQYKSPLALAKGQQDIARFTQFVQLMQGIMGADSTMAYINPANTPYLLASSLQIDPRFLNNVQQVQQAMQSMQQMMADAQAMTPQQPQNPSEQPMMG